MKLSETETAIAETERKNCNQEADRNDLQRSEKNVSHEMISVSEYLKFTL